jgi:hypothetical protein
MPTGCTAQTDQGSARNTTWLLSGLSSVEPEATKESTGLSNLLAPKGGTRDTHVNNPSLLSLPPVRSLERQDQVISAPGRPWLRMGQGKVAAEYMG